MDNRLAVFVIFLRSVSSSTVCLYTAYKSLLLFFWWIWWSATCRPGIWTTACWVVYNGSVWTIPRKTGSKEIVLVRVDMAYESRGSSDRDQVCWVRWPHMRGKAAGKQTGIERSLQGRLKWAQQGIQCVVQDLWPTLWLQQWQDETRQAGGDGRGRAAIFTPFIW